MSLVTEAVIVCREFSMKGEVEVYKVGYINNEDPSLCDGLPLQFYKIRERYDSGRIKYFAMALNTWENDDTREYAINLIKKDIPSNLYTYI